MKKFWNSLLISIILFYVSNVWAQVSVHYEIQGIKGELLTNVKDRLILTRRSSQFTTRAQINALIEKNPKEIREALMPYGYFQPIIKTTVLQKNKDWQIIYTILLNEPIRISTLKINIIGPGQSDHALLKTLKKSPIQVGDIFNSKQYENMKQNLLTTAQNSGFIKAEFTRHQILINTTKKTADVDLILSTGPRFYFGKINFNKNPFSKRFLMRYASFTRGDAFSNNQLIQYQNDLMKSGYFTNVAVTPPNTQQNKSYIPVDINLTPVKSQAYSTGIGYGTDTGIRGHLGADLRYLNSYGHKFQSRLQLSERESNIETHYIIPGAYPLTDQYSVNLIVSNNEMPHGESTLGQLGLSYQTMLGDWQQTAALNLQTEHSKADTLETTTATMLIPSISWSRVNADDLLNPTRASRFAFTTRGAVRNILSDLNFIQFKADGKFLYSFNKNQRVITRGTLGYSIVERFRELPLSLHFLTGGSQSLRGYRYQSIGPGKYLMVGSVEYQQRIYEEWFGSVFYDAGNATNQFDEPMKTNIGLGILRTTPIGPIQISVARPLNEKKPSLRLVFSLGINL